MTGTDNKGYVVVLRGSNGGYAGITTWTDYGDKATFDAEFAERGSTKDETKYLGDEEVVLENCTVDEAVALVRHTPLRAYASAAIEDATGPDGQINMEYAKFKFANAAFLFGERIRRGEKVNI